MLTNLAKSCTSKDLKTFGSWIRESLIYILLNQRISAKPMSYVLLYFKGLCLCLLTSCNCLREGLLFFHIKGSLPSCNSMFYVLLYVHFTFIYRLVSGYEEFACVPVDVAHVRMFAQLNFQWRFLISGSCTQIIISVPIKGTVSQE
jgi:hypothetical protein